ncbi:membrane protein [Neisseria arctica]|uniref:Membrane protein n=1 Tax=Neisseria arctica TaxID=1470200 RepID=A0A0J0YPW8_9NEIS|nr:hypothetical protein [Neisseria arctica]KLT72182.1 membrane protein [Neisseria arctica]UOO87297.1 hypothetical protein LVJ86_03315 [Neisseria arctica]
MFKRPEELIMAVLAALWVALTYFIADYFGAPTHTTLLISLLTLVWAVVFFILWQRNLTRLIWPIFLGLLAACWWPYLDWIAIRDIVVPGATTDTIVIAKPWYATWTFKSILSVVPVLIGYGIKWKLSRKAPVSQIP